MKTKTAGSAMTLEEVRAFCSRAHGAQQYDDKHYSFHLGQVEAVAIRFGFLGTIVRMACWSHDLIEDTSVTADDMLAAGFPARVVSITEAVSDEPGETREERKRKTYLKIRKDWLAILVKLCDRIANAENSRIHSRKKFVMYQEEQAGFKQALQNEEDWLLAPLWRHLDAVLGCDVV